MPELWMNSPIGYPYTDKVEFNNTEGLRRFLLQLAGADEDQQELIRGATRDEILRFLTDSHFTFDEQWYGVREIPMNSRGTQQSALDDPMYRMRNLGQVDRPQF